MNLQQTDVAAFLETLNTLERNPTAGARDLFAPADEIVLARAPGRLDVMGGIADYSGSLVLQWPIREATFVALQRTQERQIRIVSLGAEANGRTPDFAMPLADFEDGGAPIDYPAARSYFERAPARHWAAYAAGAVLVLMRERGVRFAEGARLLIASDVPEGKGVSSSAAIEVAAMQALTSAYGIAVEPRDMALLCQKVENLVAGAPCGVMDQMTSVCGEEGALLALLCQPAELQGTVALPDDLAVWGLDSGVRHAVSGADYGMVRTSAFMGYEILKAMTRQRAAGHRTEQGTADGTDRPWKGYLANVTPSEFEQGFAARIPERLDGKTFLADYRGVSDPLSRVRTEQVYPVRAATAHPIYEHLRVRLFAALLQERPDERRAALLGELMYQSHASYSACGLGSPGTDRLVEIVREAGPERGLYGAKITGGGSGGTVAVLARRGADAAVMDVAGRYAAETGYRPYIFAGSSPGAAAFGHLRLRRAATGWTARPEEGASIDS